MCMLDFKKLILGVVYIVLGTTYIWVKNFTHQNILCNANSDIKIFEIFANVANLKYSNIKDIWNICQFRGYSDVCLLGEKTLQTTRRKSHRCRCQQYHSRRNPSNYLWSPDWRKIWQVTSLFPCCAILWRCYLTNKILTLFIDFIFINFKFDKSQVWPGLCYHVVPYCGDAIPYLTIRFRGSHIIDRQHL